MGWRIEDGFDLDGFLAQPLVARLATNSPTGPQVRPIWFLWEDGAFWWLTGSWSKLAQIVAADPRTALVVDSCDIQTGEVKIVAARGDAEVVAYDGDRAFRKLSRYLGTDRSRWDPRFGTDGTDDDPEAAMGMLRPRTLSARDASFRAS
jgi:nitroimidazol reductase NimA-like FMN-containing flavoprotein (pyridoxamine 5'-phosphate oxidase superfamily)